MSLPQVTSYGVFVNFALQEGGKYDLTMLSGLHISSTGHTLLDTSITEQVR